MRQRRLTEDSEPAYSIRSQATHPRRSAADRGEYRQAAGFVDRLLKPWPRSRSHFTKKLRRGIFEKTEGLESLLTTSVRGDWNLAVWFLTSLVLRGAALAIF